MNAKKWELLSHKINVIGIAVFAFIMLSVAIVFAYDSFSDDNEELELVAGEIVAVSNNGRSTTDATTDIYGRNGVANFSLEVILDTNETLVIGNIGLQIIYGKLYIGDPRVDGSETADVLIELPEMFFQDFSIEGDVPLLIRAEINKDPTFFRGVDYTKDYPLDEIEITIREVVVYEKDDSIVFSVYTRVMENREAYDIKGMSVLNTK